MLSAESSTCQRGWGSILKGSWDSANPRGPRSRSRRSMLRGRAGPRSPGGGGALRVNERPFRRRGRKSVSASPRPGGRGAVTTDHGAAEINAHEAILAIGGLLFLAVQIDDNYRAQFVLSEEVRDEGVWSKLICDEVLAVGDERRPDIRQFLDELEDILSRWLIISGIVSSSQMMVAFEDWLQRCERRKAWP